MGLGANTEKQLTRNDNVTESQHGRRAPKIAGEQKFDGGVERLGDGDHHISAKHPEDIVNEETALKEMIATSKHLERTSRRQ